MSKSYSVSSLLFVATIRGSVNVPLFLSILLIFSQKCYIFATWWGGWCKNKTVQEGENWANNPFRFRRFLIRRSQVRILQGAPEIKPTTQSAVGFMCKSQDLNLRRKRFEPSARDVRQYIGEQGERAKVAEQSCRARQKLNRRRSWRLVIFSLSSQF